jgi:Tfp pilus assembly protein PilF
MTHNYYGIMLAEHGMFDKAMAQFKEALSSERHFSGILRNFCNAGIKAGKSDDVLKVIEAELVKKPQEPQLYYWAGTIYGQKGDKAKAVEQLEKALDMANSQANMALVTQIKEQLEQYRQK